MRKRGLVYVLGLSALTLSSSAVAQRASAADCFGGSVGSATIRGGQVSYTGTVTFPGANHESLVAGPGSFELDLVDAEDPARVLLHVDVPVENFRSTPLATVYDRKGTFGGTIRLRDVSQQDDTVRIRIQAKGVAPLGADSPASVRAELRLGKTCVRSCVSACTRRPGFGPLACARSALYEPFADEGFGALLRGARDPRPRSRVCGLAIEPTGPRCDFLIDERCALPYPSSVFLDPDSTTPTGLRVHYDVGSLPRNAGGKPVDPTDWNTLDGFSPGPMILALFPDSGFPVDLTASDVAFHTSYARSLEADHPTVLMQAESGERIVHFAEMDVSTDDVARKALIVRPGKRLDDATRYLVAMRDLVDTQGTPIRPRLAFRALRDAVPAEEVRRGCGEACADAIEARRAAMEDVFARLGAGGVQRGDLLLAWDFTTASARALTGWMVSIRDQAFALGTPSFTVASVDDGNGNGRNANIWARVQGTFEAPLFMTADAPGARMNFVNGEPAQNASDGFATVPYVVDIPRSAVQAANQSVTPAPARATLWGHGLLGTRTQLTALSTLANTHNFVIGAVDMQGMSNPDVNAAVLPAILDLSVFHRIPERLHQGFLHHLLIGRLFADPVNGFSSHPAFQLGANGASVIDSSQVFYSGGSQGGIFGAAIMAIAEDFERGFLAVPAANYSTLLQRSIDFLPFFAILNGSYPDALDRMILFPVIQQLWDRGEPQGYLPHILPGDLSDPPRPHEILIHMATYDSEVSNVGTEIMVRSLGIPQVAPVHRTYFQIPDMTAPYDGSAFVEIDPKRGSSRCHTPGTTDAGAACTIDAQCPGVGDPPGRTQCASGIPPLGNAAPLFNNGAHGATGTLTAGMQISAFLRDGGMVEQFCSGTCDPE